MTIWIVKWKGRGLYARSSDRCGCPGDWCCMREHAHEHLTLDSARCARDALVLDVLLRVGTGVSVDVRDILRAGLMLEFKVFRAEI